MRKIKLYRNRDRFKRILNENQKNQARFPNWNENKKRNCFNSRSSFVYEIFRILSAEKATNKMREKCCKLIFKISGQHALMTYNTWCKKKLLHNLLFGSWGFFVAPSELIHFNVLL